MIKRALLWSSEKTDLRLDDSMRGGGAGTQKRLSVDVKAYVSLFTIVYSILMTSFPVDACPACASPRR